MKLRRWHLVVGVLVLAGLAIYLYNNYSTRWYDTLSLKGRSTLVLELPQGNDVLNSTYNWYKTDNTDRLYLVEYTADGVKKTLIPATPVRDFFETRTSEGGNIILKPTAIMPDKTVVWTHREGDTWQLMKYQNGTTTVVTSLPIFDLATYARAYASGTAPSIASVQGYTSDIYRMPFVVHDDHTIGFLDAIVTGGRTDISEVTYNYKIGTLLNGEVRVVPMIAGSGKYTQNERDKYTSDWGLFSLRPSNIFDGSKKFSGLYGVFQDYHNNPLKSYIYIYSALGEYNAYYGGGVENIGSESMFVRGKLYWDQGTGYSASSTVSLECSTQIANTCKILDRNFVGVRIGRDNIRLETPEINTPINACDPVLGNLSPIPCYGTEEYMVDRYNGDTKTNLWYKKILVSKPNGHIATQLSDDRTIAMVRLGYGGDDDQFAIDIDSGRTADLRIFPSQLVLFMR